MEHSADYSDHDHPHLSPGHYEKLLTQDHNEDYGHALPFAAYRNTFITLLILTVITVAVAQFDFGVFNAVVAMIIASIKAMLVALFFMHLKYERATTWLYAAFPIILLGILMGGVFIDNPLRSHPVQDGAAAVHGSADSYGGHDKH